MATELRERLQSTLGDAYTLERELGGGGMSRVFVARDTSLGRTVVVKVLPPDLAAGVNADRFKREVQLAAQLQHPHIVPVLSAGETQGLPYYTMPFVEGESLRRRLARAGVPSITEVVGVLRDVAKALAYAHEHGVVHRDIKPDNVMLTGGSAVVADFGIAKAVSASMTDESAAAPGSTLTQVGTALGTPMYMAPEQAAADPKTDYRADLYAFGCMAYELLAGRPPFHGLTPQKLLAAQMGERPQGVQELRADAPSLLAELVMRCLEKEPDRRPQSAADLVQVLETVTSSGTGTPAMPGILLGGRGMFRKALAWYVVAFAALALFAKAAVVAIGLPDWVFAGTLVVMLLGLPVILFTAYVHRTTRRVLTTTPTLTPGGTPVAHSTLTSIAVKVSPHVTWRRAAGGGAIAVGAFALVTAGYMALRGLGIGPAGSLLASGAIERNERLLVADFASPASDTTLGPVIAEAVRAGLDQSRSVSVFQPTAVRDVLRRMQRPVSSRVDFPLAREIATREGIKAVVDGEVIGLGGNYVISIRLVAAQSGDVLASFRETADAENELLPAVDRLSKSLRAKIGESLRDVRAAHPLDQVTTSSLEALRKYVQGGRAAGMHGDFARGVALLEEAIALDTAFAMAYRALAVLYNNSGHAARAMEFFQKAYDYRHRLSDAERYVVVGSYFDMGPKQDVAKAAASYAAALDVQPHNQAALNNLALLHRFARNFAEAERLLERVIASGQAGAVSYANLSGVQFVLGKTTAASRTIEDFAKAFPGNPGVDNSRANFAFARGRYDSVAAIANGTLRRRPSDLPARATAIGTLANLARTHGRIAEARRWLAERRAVDQQRGLTNATLMSAVDQAMNDVWFLGKADQALRTLDDALTRQPIESLPVADRPYGWVAWTYALAGRPDRARSLLAEWEQSRTGVTGRADPITRHSNLGHIAIAERRYQDAVREYRAADVGQCTICILPFLAQAYDLAGDADSAMAVFTRYVDTPYPVRGLWDGLFLAGTHKRLAELSEAKGDHAKAVTHYAKFLDLWKDADPELQPKVAEVRRRLARLKAAEPR